MTKQRIFVVVPTITYRVSSEIALLFASLQKHNADPDCKWKFDVSVQNNCKPHAYMRNVCVQQFLESKADWLWFIDDDMLPSDNILNVLNGIELGADIIAPLLPTVRYGSEVKPDGSKNIKADLPICACFYEDMDDMNTVQPVDTRKGNWIWVDGVGMGCTLISGKVLRDQQMRLPITWARPDMTVHSLGVEDAPAVFRFCVRPDGHIDAGEDYEFCWRARKLGYRIALNTECLVGHLKELDVRMMLDYREFLAALQEQRFDKGVKEITVGAA